MVKKEKKAIIITCFDSNNYDVRIKYLEKAFLQMNYKVTEYASDFDHRRKCSVKASRENQRLIHVPEYKRNLSVQRILSHYVFSKRIYEMCEGTDADILYIVTPPNFLWKTIRKLKQQGRELKIIAEVGDMWPESIPFPMRIKKIARPTTRVWANLRDQNLKYADGIVFECNYFFKYLKDKLIDQKCKTINLCKEDTVDIDRIIKFHRDDSVLKIAYIGSINHIIDIDLIAEFMGRLSAVRACKLIIIGGGEKSTELLSLCHEKKIDVENHGFVFDDTQKAIILSECHFGLNLMKKSVFVGATMKSLEYYYWGLGVLNNIPEDTAEIISSSGCGFNIDDNNINDVVNCVSGMSSTQLEHIARQAYYVYKKYYNEETIINSLKDFIADVSGDKKDECGN